MDERVQQLYEEIEKLVRIYSIEMPSSTLIDCRLAHLLTQLSRRGYKLTTEEAQSLGHCVDGFLDALHPVTKKYFQPLCGSCSLKYGEQFLRDIAKRLQQAS